MGSQGLKTRTCLAPSRPRTACVRSHMPSMSVTRASSRASSTPVVPPPRQIGACLQRTSCAWPFRTAILTSLAVSSVFRCSTLTTSLHSKLFAITAAVPVMYAECVPRQRSSGRTPTFLRYIKSAASNHRCIRGDRPRAANARPSEASRAASCLATRPNSASAIHLSCLATAAIRQIGRGGSRVRSIVRVCRDCARDPHQVNQ